MLPFFTSDSISIFRHWCCLFPPYHSKIQYIPYWSLSPTAFLFPLSSPLKSPTAFFFSPFFPIKQVLPLLSHSPSMIKFHCLLSASSPLQHQVLLPTFTKPHATRSGPDASMLVHIMVIPQNEFVEVWSHFNVFNALCIHKYNANLLYILNSFVFSFCFSQCHQWLFFTETQESDKTSKTKHCLI